MVEDWELLRALVSLLVKKGIISLDELELTIEELGRIKLSDILSPEEIVDIRNALERRAQRLKAKIKSIQVKGWAAAMYRHGLESDLKIIEKILGDLENLSKSDIGLLQDFLERHEYKNEQVLRKLNRLIQS